MNFSKLNDRISVAGQLEPDDMVHVYSQGFRTIICNRPDNEGPGQPSFAQIKAAASAAGLAAFYIPIVPGQAGQAEVSAFADAIDSQPGPVLAYCRSGARSKAIYDAVRSMA